MSHDGLASASLHARVAEPAAVLFRSVGRIMVLMPDLERHVPLPASKQNEAIVEQVRQKFVPLVDRLRPEMESAATFDVTAQSTLTPFPKPR